jgi:hypothetical protein
MAKLNTTKAVIDALGGVKQVAKLTSADYNAAWNWTVSKTFPADTHDVMTKALAANGHTAPSSLWRQRQRPPRLQLEALAG